MIQRLKNLFKTEVKEITLPTGITTVIKNGKITIKN